MYGGVYMAEFKKRIRRACFTGHRPEKWYRKIIVNRDFCKKKLDTRLVSGYERSLYIIVRHEIDGSTLQISNEEVIRLYSRLRLVGTANTTYTVSVTGFCPADSEESGEHSYTLTANSDGNAFLYGTFAEGAILTVNGVTSRFHYLNGTKHGTSYGICAVHTAAEGAETNCMGKKCDLCGLYFGTKDESKHITEKDKNKATCKHGDICDLCNTEYGETDNTNHDATVDFDDNGFCPNGCAVYEPAKDTDNDGYYEIRNAGQLYWFAEKVNGGANDINAILMENITINEKVLDAEGNLIADPSGLRQWTPIGHYLSADDFYSFDGIFDGNGKTITGLYHNDSYAKYAGLFGYSTGTIQDLTLADTYINTTRSDGRAGSVAGLNEGTVRNCHLVSGYVSGNSQIGGIVGRMNAGSIEDCTNTGTVNSAANNAGGICGYSSAGTIPLPIRMRSTPAPSTATVM